MENLKKLRIKVSHDSTISLLVIYLEKTIIQKYTCSPMFTAALLTITRLGKQLRCALTDKWMKKLWYVYTLEYCSAIKGTNLSQFY